MGSTFSSKLAIPFYRDQVGYRAMEVLGMNEIMPWTFRGWKAESMAWKTGCSLHSGLSKTGEIVLKGPDAGKYLESLSINSFAKFPVGSMKHVVMCDEEGLIVCHAIVERKADDEFHHFAGGPYPLLALDSSRYRVEPSVIDNYLFQIAGPASLQVLEKVTGESLRDIRFLHFRDSSINGTRTEVARIGMSGNLAYELHGPAEEGPEIYDAVWRSGREFGLERLGWGTYLEQHVEGGFPQATWTFAPASGRPGLDVFEGYNVSGSVDPANKRARFRTPFEVNWSNMARFDHEFIGREAVERELADPKRKTVTLRWNSEDVLDIYASLLRPGEEYKTIELPYSPNTWPQAHADHIVKDGRRAGISSGTTYSYYFREVLSMGCIDLEASEIGTEVVVQWGDYGGPIKDVRATVARFPYLTEGRNSEVDVAALK